MTVHLSLASSSLIYLLGISQFTADFAKLPGVVIPSLHARTKSRREASGSSMTPRGSPTRTAPATPLIPQTTGEWFPSFRRSLLRGRSLNRFSSFVTSGAEDFVLHGSVEEEAAPPEPAHSRATSTASVDEDESRRGSVLNAGSDTEKHFVETGPAWRSKLPAFHVLVHSPSKRSSGITGPYTVYTLTSVFDSPDASLAQLRSASDPDADDEGEVGESADASAEPASITVQRRFSHFVVLHTALTRRLPGIALPPLPEKQYAGRFNDDFVEARRGDLERYINRVVRHPVARYAEVLTFFLGCESDAVSIHVCLAFTLIGECVLSGCAVTGMEEATSTLFVAPTERAFVLRPDLPPRVQRRRRRRHRRDRPLREPHEGGGQGRARPAQHFRSSARSTRRCVAFAKHTPQNLRGTAEMSKAERLLSYSLLSLITAKPLASSSSSSSNPSRMNNADSDDDDEGIDARRGHVNADGAWCWRENCDGMLRHVLSVDAVDRKPEECLRLTKAVQRTAETMISVADLFDDHVRAQNIVGWGREAELVV